jgi:ABC-2 type transport system ATP-binding protein
MRRGRIEADGGPAVAVRSLRVRIGERNLLDDLSLDVERGSAHAIVGPNGSGKTTLLKAIVGLHRPNSGEVRLWSSGSASEFRRARRRSALCLGGDRGLYPKLTAPENGLYYASMYGQAPRKVERHLLELLRNFELPLDQRVESFSRGMKQKLHLARAAALNPDLLLVDEPTSNLDEASAQYARSLVAAMIDRGCAVVVATHEIGDIDAWKAHAHAINQGRITHSLEHARFESRRKTAVLEITFSSELASATYEPPFHSATVVRKGCKLLVSPAPNEPEPMTPGRDALFRSWTLNDFIDGLV